MRRLLLGGGILILVGLLASTQVMNSSICCRPIPSLFARLSNFSRGDDPQPLPPPADVVEDVREFGQRALPNPLPGLCPLYVSASLSLSLYLLNISSSNMIPSAQISEWHGGNPVELAEEDVEQQQYPVQSKALRMYLEHTGRLARGRNADQMLAELVIIRPPQHPV